MNENRLSKLRAELGAFRRRGGIKPGELEGLAKELGRTLSDRGSEPTWVNLKFPDLRPLSIPHHGAKDLNRFTAKNIIDQLECDVDRWEEELR